MNKLLILLLLIPNICNAGWYNNWYNNQPTISHKKIIKDSIEYSCISHISKYKKLMDVKPGSKYYKWKFESWTRRCNKEKLKGE